MSIEVSIVVPTFNEAENIAVLIGSVDAVLDGIAWEMIFVDDNSPDGTTTCIKEIARRDPRIRCLHRINRRGLAGACIEGMLSSSAPFLVVIDADLQHDVSILPKMMAALRGGNFDLAIGSRHVDSGSADSGFSSRRASISRSATVLAQYALHTEIEDLMSGFFAIRRECFDAVAPRLTTSGFKLLADIVASSDRQLRTVEIGYVFRPRQSGESKLDLKVALDFVGFLVSKASRGLISTRFFSFAIVGSLGVFFHLLTLWTTVSCFPEIGFSWAQAVATLVAMTSNFYLNNIITYRDHRLRGFTKLMRGLLAFWGLCALGAIANVAVATWVFQALPIWWIAGIAGLVTGATWNYTLISLFVWPRQN